MRPRIPVGDRQNSSNGVMSMSCTNISVYKALVCAANSRASTLMHIVAACVCFNSGAIREYSFGKWNEKFNANETVCEFFWFLERWNITMLHTRTHTRKSIRMSVSPCEYITPHRIAHSYLLTFDATYTLHTECAAFAGRLQT